jgi:hypothetical protein
MLVIETTHSGDTGKEADRMDGLFKVLADEEVTYGKVGGSRKPFRITFWAGIVGLAHKQDKQTTKQQVFGSLRWLSRIGAIRLWQITVSSSGCPLLIQMSGRPSRRGPEWTPCDYGQGSHA